MIITIIKRHAVPTPKFGNGGGKAQRGPEYKRMYHILDISEPNGMIGAVMEGNGYNNEWFGGNNGALYRDDGTFRKLLLVKSLLPIKALWYTKMRCFFHMTRRWSNHHNQESVPCPRPYG